MKKISSKKLLAERSMLGRLLGRRQPDKNLNQRQSGGTKVLLIISLVVATLAGGLITQIIKNYQTTAAPGDFVMNINSGDDRVFKIPIFNKNLTGTGIASNDYYYTIDWGDGTVQSGVTTMATHTYANANQNYTISIGSGAFPGMTFDDYHNTLSATELANLAKKVHRVSSWGNIQWKNMRGMFKGASNLTSVSYLPLPNTSQVQDMSYMFQGASSLTSVSQFDTSNVTNMASMFKGASSLNQTLNFNTSKVTNMANMLEDATAFNQDLSHFDFSKITNSSNLNNFASNSGLSTENYDKLLKRWHAQLGSSSVTGYTPQSTGLKYCNAEAERNYLKNTRSWTFNDTKDCSEHDAFITRWTDLPAGALTINLHGNNNTFQINWGDGTTETLTNVGQISHNYANSGTYDIAISTDITGGKFNGWGLSVAGMSKAEYLTHVLNWGDISFTNMSVMFNGATNLSSLPATALNTANVTDMSFMFAHATSFNQPVNFDTSSVTNMSGMFNGATSFNQPINFNTPNLINAEGMFSGATSFNQPVSFSDTDQITNISWMFLGATSFNQPINFDTSSVTDMHSLFNGATSFNQPVSFNTSQVTDISWMFKGATSFNQDVSGFDFSHIGIAENGFSQLTDFASNSGLSTKNYDKLLKKWHAQWINGSSIHAPKSTGLTYCTAETERNYLKDTKGWTFSDTKDCSEINVAPADITLSNNQLDENNAPNFELADINITNDPGDIAGDTNTASLTCAVAGADDASFQIAGNKLVLRPSANFEAKSSYAICLRATDAGGLTLDKNFTISVRDVNETPVIADQTFSVAENSANGTELGQVAASDPDAGQAIAYTIVGGNDLGIFTLSADGKLTIANNANLNYEQHQSISLQIRVTDNGTPALSDDATITVNITDINEAPVITSTPNLTAVKGEQYSYTITVTDEDNNGLTYAATVLPSWLSFDAGTRVLSGTPGNAEANNDYNVTLTVNDGEVIAEQSFTIHVNDKNYAPVIADQSFTIAENSANSTEAGQVVATEPDAGQALTYNIVSGNDLNIFALSTDGKLTIANNTNLDYETHTSVTLRVRVTDNGSPVLQAEADVTVTITDVNETPTISGAPATNVDQDATYSFTPVVSDPDGSAPNNTLTFAIDNKPSWLNFDTNTGALTGTPTNAEVGNYENIVIRVTDGGGLTAALPAFNITVNNINDTPVITDQAFSVAENSANGTVVGQVTASDIDAGQNLSYEIVGGNSLGMFALSANGQLTVADNNRLDFEDVVQVVLRVRVSDNGTPAMNAEADVTVNITDVNEAPNFTSSATLSLAHNEVLTHNLSATDPENATLTYSATGLPAWMSLTGNILTLTPTAAQIGEYDVTVKVSDSVNETSQAIHITVREANVAPVMTDQTFNIDENSFNGTLVGALVATDANANDNLNFTIIGGNELGIFNLGSDGKLTIANNTNLDYEARQSVTLRARVSDNGTPVLSTEANVVINITDVDDEAPTITLSATDPITLKEGEDFTLPTADCHDNQSSCTMTITNPVDVNAPGVYQIVYKAVDAAGNQTIAQVQVTVKAKMVVPNQPTIPFTPTNPTSPITPMTPRLTTPRQPSVTTTPTAEEKSNSAPFTLKHSREIVLNLNETYHEPGVECAESTNCTVEITGKVDTSRAGTYTITYRLANGDYTLTRTVIVRDPAAANADTNQSQSADSANKNWWQDALSFTINFWWLWLIVISLWWLIIFWRRRKKEEHEVNLPPRRRHKG